MRQIKNPSRTFSKQKKKIHLEVAQNFEERERENFHLIKIILTQAKIEIIFGQAKFIQEVHETLIKYSLE